MNSKEVSRSLDLALERRVSPRVNLAELAPYIRVSSLGSCGRQTLLKLSHPHEQTAPDAESSFAMLQGDWAESGMQKLLLEAGFILRDSQRELSFYNSAKDEVLRGHIDGLLGLDTGLGTQWSLWENKAMSAFRFKKVVQQGVKESCPEYIAQMQTYMWLLRSQGEETITDCIFTAEAKDPSAANMGNKGPRLNPIHTERVQFDQELADGFIERAVDLYETLKAKETWPHERTPGKDWDCSEKFCAVYRLCDPKNTIQKRGAA